MELPAATTVVTPEFTRLLIALFNDVDLPPPRLKFAVAGFFAFFWTQLIPAMTPEYDPLPVHESTFTPTSFDLVATPYVFPPIVPATWVP